jgi:hypothetical protein
MEMEGGDAQLSACAAQPPRHTHAITRTPLQSRLNDRDDVGATSRLISRSLLRYYNKDGRTAAVNSRLLGLGQSHEPAFAPRVAANCTFDVHVTYGGLLELATELHGSCTDDATDPDIHCEACTATKDYGTAAAGG